MTTMTTHVVKARNLRQTDTIQILGNAFAITNLTFTGSAVFVCAESSDEIGSIMTEGMYQLDQPITVLMPAN